MQTVSDPILPFLFGEFPVRVLVKNSVTWFVAKDVCAILDIQNHRDTLVKLIDEDEKGVATIYTRGGDQQFTLINESGLYRLIFKSRKAEAKTFQRWLFHEVLPSIRRTGSYSSGQSAFIGFVEELIALGCSPDLSLRAAMRHSPVAHLARKPEIVARATEDDQEIMEIVSLLIPGQRNYVSDLADKLPSGHRLASQSLTSRIRGIGWILRKAEAKGLVKKDTRSRNAAYTLIETDNIVSIQ